MRPAIKVGLSTASVYPEKTEAAFEYAANLGYDGVELNMGHPNEVDASTLKEALKRSAEIH